jgi:hypothetical protein
MYSLYSNQCPVCGDCMSVDRLKPYWVSVACDTCGTKDQGPVDIGEIADKVRDALFDR